jgi:glutaredoxin
MRTWIAWIAVLALACAASAQKRDAKDVCPYCKNDPALLAKAGLVNHGPFDFGKNGIEQAETLLAAYDVRWIQSKHFEIGFALGAWKVKDDERKQFRAELERLAEALPKVDPKARIIDPWLRVHLYSQRAEDIYARFQQVLQIDDSMFPDGTKPWDLKGKYMGEGPFLGEKGKFEVLLLPAEAASISYLRNEFGLTTKLSQRWNVIEKDTLSLIVHTAQGSLHEDMALHGHLAFNLTINMLDAYKHYSYDTPI